MSTHGPDLHVVPDPPTRLTPFDITGDLPEGTTLLEASAGTGKTWTIGALVARYVAEDVARLEEMLVITFGRAASQELRERVREHLRRVHGELSDPERPSDDPVVALLRDGTEEEVAARTRRLHDALTGFDAATIATTHTFCQIVLRGLGIAGDTDARAHLVEDLTDLIEEVTDDLYLAEVVLPAGEADPPFDRATAGAIAQAVTDDPHARIVPAVDDLPLEDHRGRARLTFGRRVREELTRRKRRLGVLSFDDLLSELADALADEAAPARGRMRHRWPIVLVDEFQDTDPVQWQVLERAFHGHSRLVLIGDPKQAIYGFRGGDVETYLQACQSAESRRTLDTNHRSDRGLVDALGVVLSGAELGHPEIVVHPVQAALPGPRLTTRSGASAPPVRLRQVASELVAVDGAIYVDRVREVISPDAAAEIARLLDADLLFDGRPLRAGDIAVLASRNADLTRMRSALADRGIRSILVGTDSVFASAAATEWLTLLTALDATHRAPLVRAAALTPFVGLDASELDEGGDALVDDLARRLRSWGELFARRGIAAVMAAAGATGLDARVLGVADGARHLTDLRHLAELLHQRSVLDGLGLASLSTWLREAIADGGRQERSRRLDSDADAVHLSTIHASKGLQYPVVVAPFLTLHPPGDRPPDVLRFHDPVTQERCLDIGHRSDAGRAVREQAYRDGDLGESMRVLYVAMTRAQSHLLTWWSPSGRNTASAPLHRLLFGRRHEQGPSDAVVDVPGDETAKAVLDGWREQGGPSVELLKVRPRVVEHPQEEPPELSTRQLTREIDETWRRTSYSALAAAGEGGTAALSGDSFVGSEIEDSPKRDDEGSIGAAGPADTGADADPDTTKATVTPTATATAAAATGMATTAAADVPSPMADLPVGATFGSLVHAVLEHADPQAEDLTAELGRHLDEQYPRWPVPDLDRPALAEALTAVCDTPLGPLAGDATLRQIGRPDRLCEMDFELPLAGGDQAPEGAGSRLGDLAPLLRAHLPEGDPVRGWADALADPALGEQHLRGYLTGSIDVALRVDGRYLVVDYKTNWLGAVDEPLTARTYDPAALDAAMGHSSYPLQALLYAVVLHRFLRWRLPDYDPERHLGGVLYLYVRGMCGPQTPVVDGHPCGVFSWRPPVTLVMAVSDLLDGRGGPA